MGAAAEGADPDPLIDLSQIDFDGLARRFGDRKRAETDRLAQQLGDRSLFVIRHGRDQLVPAVLLTEAGEPRPELRPLLEVLLDADGLGGWSIWTWLTAHSSLL
ncbi:hypothetical protein [Geodermatophilus ruber]|uniref:hypothetical protein n=1 Tax=Geodermatophilus ruber TaxID=504800 RepID=UPI000B808D08|nr:hypothetical protein [Geodermatophilus ruber]